MEAKIGSRWASSVCDTEVVVVAAPDGQIALECGGAPMVAVGTERAGGSPDPAFAEGTLIGKRYVDADGTIEVLVTKPGAGSLSLGGQPLVPREAKPLPASD